MQGESILNRIFSNKVTIDYGSFNNIRECYSNKAVLY